MCDTMSLFLPSLLNSQCPQRESTLTLPANTNIIVIMADGSSNPTDPYLLAHEYWNYINDKPRRRGEHWNAYYEKILANQPEPERDATDDRSRAIRYAKEHHECFYEIRDVKRIIQWLDDDSVKQQLVVYTNANHLVPNSQNLEDVRLIESSSAGNVAVAGVVRCEPLVSPSHAVNLRNTR